MSSTEARKTWTQQQVQRLYANSPEIHGDVKSFAGFERVVRLVEAARGDGLAELLQATTALLSALQHGAMGRSLEPFEKAARAAVDRATAEA